MKSSIKTVIFLVCIIISCGTDNKTDFNLPDTTSQDDSNTQSETLKPYTVKINNIELNIGDTFDFGSAIYNSESIQYVIEIKNQGKENLFYTGFPIISISGSNNFKSTTPTITNIPPGEISNFEISFEPTIYNEIVSQVSISLSEKSLNKFMFYLKGNGIKYIQMQLKQLDKVIPNNYNFITDGVKYEMDNILTFKIKNIGVQNLKLLNSPPVKITNGSISAITLDQPLKSTLSQNESDTFTLHYLASNNQSRSISLNIESNSKNDSSFNFDIKLNPKTCSSCKIFVTSGSHNGNFGGLSGADTFCNTQASLSTLTTGYYVSLLSTSSVNASQRTLNSVYINTNSQTISYSNSSLWDGNINNSIDNQYGNITSSDLFTGSNYSGNYSGYNYTCYDWTSSSTSSYVRVGYNYYLDWRWFDNTSQQFCDNYLNIYCVQVME